MDDKLKTRNTNVAPSLLGKVVVPHQYMAGTSPTKIWGKNLQKESMIKFTIRWKKW